jgi:hypothetical protein
VDLIRTAWSVDPDKVVGDSGMRGRSRRETEDCDPVASRLITCRDMTLTQFAAELNAIDRENEMPTAN